MEFNLIDIWNHMGWPAMVVSLALAAMGLASLTVLAERVFTLRSSRAASRHFAATIVPELRAARVDAIVERAADPAVKRGHLSRVVHSTMVAYQHARSTADVAGLQPSERVRRHVERLLDEMSTDLRRGMSVLASVGSTAPFIGLLGTVVGIISAFQGIAATGSGGLSSVSAGISEALVVTAFGLAVAIPAVLAFNFLSTQVAEHERVLTHAAGELLDTIEDWEERRLHEARRTVVTPAPRVAFERAVPAAHS